MKKNDIILFSIIILIAVVTFSIFFLINIDSSTDTVVVTLDGTVIAEYPLNKDVEVWIDASNGEGNLLVIDDGKAYIREATCKNQICVQSGVVQELKPVSCLPHKLLITIKEK